MKPRKSSMICHSFQDLKVLPKIKPPPPPKPPDPQAIDRRKKIALEDEEKLFSDAMEGVNPISRDNCVERSLPNPCQQTFEISLEGENGDAEALSQLISLVENGEGFNIVDTSEYIEGTGYNIHPEIARRLHQGNFSIQAHVDLHGLKEEDAREIFQRFLRWAVQTGKRGVLIIHGRGLSSPSEPILKTRVVEWLTHGPWRKWVIAFCSARLCDGGAGATYVLLRQRPVSKPGKRHPPTS